MKLVMKLSLGCFLSGPHLIIDSRVLSLFTLIGVLFSIVYGPFFAYINLIGTP